MADFSLRLMPVAPGWAIVFAGALVAAIAAWTYRRTARELAPRTARVLAAIRVATLLAIVGALLGPTLRTYAWAGLRGQVAIVADDSESMTIPDAGRGDVATRARALATALEGRSGLADRLERSATVRLLAFGEKLRPIESVAELAARDSRTDIAGALAALASVGAAGEARTVAAVLLSDGADTEGGDVEEQLRKLAASGLPVYTIAIGGNEFRDVEISRLHATRTVRKDTLVSVSATVTSRGVAPAKMPIRLLELPATAAPGGFAQPAARLIAEQLVDLGGPPAAVTFEFLPAETGFREYAVELPVAEGEVVARNNRREFALTVERRKIKVLYMEGSEYRRPERKLWEFQYLEEALGEDGDIEVTSLLRKDAAHAREAGIYTVQDPLHGYPRTKKGLFEYDVVISSDIDIDFFTPEQLAATVEFVGRRGGGFVMIGGWTAFGAGGYDDSVIDKMLPVDMVGRKFEGYKENEEFRLEVTEEGLRHPIMQLGETPERTRFIWESCPPFYGHNQVQRAKPAATVLAYHEEERNLYGKTVVLAVQDYGRGRSMAMTTDTTAGWGESFEEEFGEDGDNRHYKKFWQNAIRWLAEYRLKAPSRLVQLEVSSSLVPRGLAEKVRVTVLDEFYEPAAGADVSLRLERPDGTEANLALFAEPGRPGGYAAEVPFADLGRHVLEASASLKGTPLGTDRVSVGVRPSSREFERPEAGTGLLRRIAERTGGRYYELRDASRVPEDIGDLVASVRRHVDEPLWDTVWLWAVVLGLLSAEWLIRKKAGLP